MQPVSLFPDWLSNLTLQQQAVLMAATRGQDGDPKHTGFKVIQSALRASIMKAAHTGRMAEMGEHLASFMSLVIFANGEKWVQHIQATLENEGDGCYLHYYMHLAHAAQILGYKHPDPAFRDRWYACYMEMAHKLHLNTESEQQMDERLGDFGRTWEEPVQQIAPYSNLTLEFSFDQKDNPFI
jgi:hypothetical protein